MTYHKTAMAWAAMTLLAPVAMASANGNASPAYEATPSSIIIYASRFEEPLESSSPQTVIITDKEIQKSGYSNVSEVLQKIGGLNVKSNLDGSTNGSIDIRGFGDAADNNVVVLVDGVRLSANEQAVARTSLIPLEAIDHIEITRGGHSVLYGDGATGGVINIITKTKLDDLTVFTAGVGSYQKVQSSVFLSRKSDDVNITVYGRQYDNAGYRDYSGVAERSAGFSAIKHLSGTDSLGIRASVGRERDKLPGALPFAYLNLNPKASQVANYTSNAQVDTGSLTVFGSFNLKKDVQLKLDLNRSTKSNDWSYNYDASAIYAGYNPNVHPGQSPFAWGTSRSNSQTNSFNPRVKFDNWLRQGGVLIVGYDWRQYERTPDAYKTNSDSHYYSDSGNSTNINDGSYGFQAFKTHGSYVRSELPLGQNDSITLGARRQQYSQESVYHYYNGGNTASCDPAFYCDPSTYSFNNSGSASAYEAQYNRALQEHAKVYFRMGRNFRFANLDDNAQAPFAVKNNLNPQISQDYEAGLSYRSSRLKSTLILYVSRLTNEIGFDGTSNLNFDPTKRQGVESVSSYAINPALQLMGTLNLSESKFSSGQYVGKKVPGTSSVIGSLGVHYQLSPKERLGWQTRFASNAYASGDMNNAQVQRPGFGVSDISYVYSEHKWQVTASINNIFNKTYADSAIYKSAYYPLYQLTVYPNPGRNFGVTGRYSY